MDIKKILFFIKETIENSVVGAVASIKKHIFTVKLLSNKVEVVNFPQTTKLSQETIDKINQQLKIINETIAKLKLNPNIIVPEIKPPTIPKIKVPEAKVKVDIPEIKIPEVKVPEVEVDVNKLRTELLAIKKAIENIKLNPIIKTPEVIVPEPKVEVKVDKEKIVSNDPKKYVPVRLTDGKEFYKALDELTLAIDRAYSFSFSNGVKGQALIDKDRHVQVDVLNFPETSDVNVLSMPEEYKKVSLDYSNENEIYIGYLKKNSDWYIVKRVFSNDSFIDYFTKGKNNFITNWQNRASLEYKLYNEL